MKVYVTFDMEGTSGTAFRAQMSPDSSIPGAYQRALRFATDEVKAAIDGILGVDPNAEIFFNDAHAASMNIFFEELPESTKIVVGSAETMDEVLGLDDSFDALVCIGAHANETTADAVLCHVWGVRELTFDRKPLTETDLDAALAGYYNVPLVAISGDEATVRAIQENMPKVAAAVVKKGLGMYSAISLHPKKAQKLIKEAVIDGLKRRKEIHPVTYKNPITVEIDYRDPFRAYANCVFMRNDERVSATKIKYVAPNAKDAYFGFLTRIRVTNTQFNRFLR